MMVPRFSSKQVLPREIKSALGRAEMTQKELALRAGFTPSNLTEKMKGRVAFSFEDLLAIAGVLGLSLEELLGSSLLTAKVPAPSYFEDEKGRKKVAPVGFIPTGTTYHMVTSADLALDGVGPAGLEPATKGIAVKPPHQTTPNNITPSQNRGALAD